jgi:AbiV family abortive infection protein
MIYNKSYQSIIECVRNGKRLLDDAQLLFDFGRVPSAYAISMLSQEEFAKAFILLLVKDGAIPWNREIWKSTQDHTCKQLLIVVMEYLNPTIEEFIDWVKSDNLERPFTPSVADAINIYRHEKVRRWQNANWVWAEETRYDATASKIARGVIEKRKQNALYVRLTKTSDIACLPSSVTKEMVEIEIERAGRLHQLTYGISENSANVSIEYETLKDTLKLVFSDDFYKSGQRDRFV